MFIKKQIKLAIQKLKKQLSADSVKKGKEWQGYSVYLPIYKHDEVIGLPRLILEKDGNLRLSSYEEWFDYMDATRKIG